MGPDGGSTLAGYTMENATGTNTNSSEWMAVKLDVDGAVQWQWRVNHTPGHALGENEFIKSSPVTAFSIRRKRPATILSMLSILGLDMLDRVPTLISIGSSRLNPGHWLLCWAHCACVAPGVFSAELLVSHQQMQR